MTQQANTPKTWQEMSKEERHALMLQKKTQAHALTSTGEFPPAVKVKIGDMTLHALPSGVSERGSVSYSINPTTLTVIHPITGAEKRIRINKLNLSVLADDSVTSDGPVDLSGAL